MSMPCFRQGFCSAMSQEKSSFPSMLLKLSSSCEQP